MHIVTVCNPVHVSVVIPALNEAKTIEAVVQACKPFAEQVIVVDGGSHDRTADLAGRAGAHVLVVAGQGKGAAIRFAMPYIQGDIVVFLDADGSHDPQDIPKLLQPIVQGEADHVSGSRLIGGSSELHGTFDECFRLMGSALITAVINWRFGVRLSESQNGFRAIRTTVLKALNLRENATTIEQEMIIKTLRKGYRMAEVPTHEYARQHGTSHIRLRKVWLRYVYCVVKNLL